MTAPYSLRTLASPQVRWKMVYATVTLGLAGVSGALGTVNRSAISIVCALVALVGGLAVLSIVDEQAREIESET